MKEFEGKKLLILGGIKMECEIVKAAKKMGAYVIVADYDKEIPASKYADKTVDISATDVDSIVDFCKNEKIDGITTGFVDILMTPCYEVAKRLGLPYYGTKKMLSMSMNKIDFKSTCNKYGIPVPETYYSGSQINEAITSDIRYPVFIKPLDSSGSKGAGVCNNQEELKLQFDKAKSYSVTGNVVLEEYLEGREFLLDYVGVNGEFKLLSMFDRYVRDGRNSAVNYSDLSLAPSKAIESYYNNINDKVTNMFRQLGFKDGLVFLQGYSNGEKIIFYEMGCRLGGSFFNLEEKMLNLNPVEMTVRYALTGEMMNSIDNIRDDSANFKKIAYVCNYLLDLELEGEKIASINGVEDVTGIPSFVSVIRHRDIGFEIINDRIVDKPVLTFFMVDDNIEDVKKTLEIMNDKISVVNSYGKSLLTKKFDYKELT